MHAMILAAGRGERMRPLTDTRPKPLLEVGGKPLIQYHLEALARAASGTSSSISPGRASSSAARWATARASACSIRYSDEPEGALETGGGILRGAAVARLRAVPGDQRRHLERISAGLVHRPARQRRRCAFRAGAEPRLPCAGRFRPGGRAAARPRAPSHIRQHRRVARRVLRRPAARTLCRSRR